MEEQQGTAEDLETAREEQRGAVSSGGAANSGEGRKRKAEDDLGEDEERVQRDSLNAVWTRADLEKFSVPEIREEAWQERAEFHPEVDLEEVQRVAARMGFTAGGSQGS